MIFRFPWVLSLLAQFRLSYGTRIEVADTAAEPFLSRKIDGLLDLTKRQGETCSLGPGGPICDAVHCCALGQECCPSGCCPNTSACFQADRCCPLTSTICSGQTACCPSGSTCCGSTCCDSSIEFCERGHCLDRALKNSVVRFEQKSTNQELLENMCKGMELGNGEKVNAETLTYRGKEKGGQSRGPIRRAAGCVRGYCSNSANNGGNPTFNSCDEYPPASSLEGGAARLASERIITCIPASQNGHQGWMFMQMLAQFAEAIGREMMRGEEFVISIDCDSVLPPTVRRLQKRASFGDSGFAVVDPGLTTTNVTSAFVLVALGDLAAGTYDVTIQGARGSTTGGFAFDSEGDDTFVSLNSGLTPGQSQAFSFAFNDDMFGVSIALNTGQNDTNVTWSLGGSTSIPGTVSATSTSLQSGLAIGTATAGSGISSAGSMFLHCQGISGWVVLVTATVLGFSFM